MQKNDSNPTQSLYAFTGRIIDYAGLFPPTSLELKPAFSNYLNYLNSHYEWMLSKFIIPAKKLNDLKLLSGIIPADQDKIDLSVLAAASDNKDDLLLSFNEDIKRIVEFLQGSSSDFKIDTIELKLPVEFIRKSSIGQITETIDLLGNGFARISKGYFHMFFEAAELSNFDETLIKTAEAISLSKNDSRLIGFKLRTGGVTPDAFPSSEQIAFAIMTCLEYNIPVKCTAGLHHPVRHFDKSVSSVMHGFLNVIGAGILAYLCDLDEYIILEILEEEDADEFEFNNDTFKWHDYEVTSDDIKQARENFMLSFGSCSFEEPVEDLQKLELL